MHRLPCKVESRDYGEGPHWTNTTDTQNATSNYDVDSEEFVGGPCVVHTNELYGNHARRKRKPWGFAVSETLLPSY